MKIPFHYIPSAVVLRPRNSKACKLNTLILISRELPFLKINFDGNAIGRTGEGVRRVDTSVLGMEIRIV